MAEPAKTTRPAQQDLISMREAADILGGTPWDVMRLIDSRKIDFVPLVDRASLLQHLGAAR